jgi:uncharacterized damage-inducible protein DinB
MNTIEFISQSLQQVQIRLLATCDGLADEQVLWRPSPHSNNIGFILWHVARAEDEVASRLRGGEATLWVTDLWFEKFGQPVDSPDPGDRMGLRALSIPPLDTLIGYLEAVYRRTREAASGLTESDLDGHGGESPTDRTTGMSLRHLITHKNNHHGQIDYIRGLQDDTWDLPRGTGVQLPKGP